MRNHNVIGDRIHNSERNARKIAKNERARESGGTWYRTCSPGVVTIDGVQTPFDVLTPGLCKDQFTGILTSSDRYQESSS